MMERELNVTSKQFREVVAYLRGEKVLSAKTACDLKVEAVKSLLIENEGEVTLTLKLSRNGRAR